MKKGLLRQILAFVLVLAMLLPSLADAVALSASAETTTYGAANVYDVFDLTGSEANTVKGTNDTWDGVVIGSVSAEHKENIVFKTKLTMGAQEVRLALNSLEGNSIYDPQGYAVYINHNGGAPYIAIKRNQSDLVVGSVASVAGTWELEIGLVDILTDGVRTGKHVYVKKDGVVVCEADDTSGYLTGDSLGTRFVDFHYGASIQMDTTYTSENTYGTATVYDIFDLTGSETNTVNGTDATWDGVVLGNVDAAHKENMAFKTELTMGAQQVRLSLNAKEGASIYDPPGYAVYLYGDANRVEIRRNNATLKDATVDGVAGTYIFEAGIVDILQGETVVGKHLYVKMNDVVVCEYDDMDGYLTGDNLGTKLIDFHYGAAIQMDSTKELEPETTEPETTEPMVFADVTVYDIYDLTGFETNAVNGTGNGNWTATVLGNFDAEHKENAALKAVFTTSGSKEAWDNIRLSLGAKESDDLIDPKGYALVISVDENGVAHIHFKRAGSGLVTYALGEDTVPSSAQLDHVTLEFGYKSILSGETIVGKRLYLAVNGEETYTYDDTDGFLTGDALGTKVGMFHYLNVVTMDTAKTNEKTYGTAEVYDIYDLTGAETNTVNGTDATWDGVVLGNVDAAHKENMAFKTELTMGAQQVRLSLNAKEGASIYDPPGYAVYLYGDTNRVEIRRNNATLKDATVDGVAGTYIFEAGIVDILQGETVVGKHLYVKMNDVVVCEYDDMDGYLTGDSLGTKLIDFHYGAAIQMDTTKEIETTEPETTEPETTEPETTEPETTEPETVPQTYGEATVYDIYDLTDQAFNTVNGTDATWDGVVLGAVDAAHKENMAFKTELTMGAQQVRLSLNAKEGASIYDPPGYAVYLYGDANRVEIRRNNATLKDATVDGVAGTYIFEAGIVDILQGETVVGKHLYVKMNDVVVCEYDDLNGYLTGDALGTRIIDFHYGAAIQMDTTKEIETTEPETTEPETTEPETTEPETTEPETTEPETTEPETTEPETTEPETTEPMVFADVTVYDIYDLTGFETNAVNGTGNGNWTATVLGNFDAEHKENAALKAVFTTSGSKEAWDNIRLSLGAKESDDLIDPKGYALVISVDENGVAHIHFKRAGSGLVTYALGEDTVPSSAQLNHVTLEFGYRSILSGETIVGKRLYLAVNGEETYTYDDTDGFLTGDALGTKVGMFHYLNVVTMDTTKTIEKTYGTAEVYDIYDLTGAETNTVNGTDATWDGVVLGAVDAAHKENMAFKTELTMGAQEVRLSLNALAGLTQEQIWDAPGYAVYLHGAGNLVQIRRNNTILKEAAVDGVAGTYVLEAGIVDILEDGNRVGKHLYVKMDDVVVCEYDDLNGYLTGDSLGTNVIDFHYGAAIQMNTTKENIPTEPETEPGTQPETAPQTYGEATVYDIYDLTGQAGNTVNGTDATWDGVVLGAVDAAHKENMAFKTELTMGQQEVRLSLNAKDGLTQEQIWDAPGYAVYLHGAGNLVQIRRNNTILKEATVDGVVGTYVLEAGIVDILEDGNRVGKHLYVKMDDVVVCEYDDLNGYLTGDSLGTNVIDFHYGAAIRMNSTKETVPTEPETEPVTGPQTVADATVYDLYALMGVSEITAAGQLQGVWGTTLGHVSPTHKTNVAFATDIAVDEPQTIMLGLGLSDLSMAVQLNSGYVLEIVNKTGEGEVDTVKIHRAGTQIYIQDTDADFHGEHAFEYGMVDILVGSTVVGKRIYVKLDGAEVFHYDDKVGFLTAAQTGTKVDIYVSGNDLQMGSSRNLAAGEAKVYDLYDMQGLEYLTLVGRTTDPEKWGTTLGNILEEHKENMAFRTTVTMDEPQTVMLGLGLADQAMAVQLSSGYVLEIVLKTGTDEVDTVKIHRAGTQIYCEDQSIDLNGEYELEFGIVDLYDLDADNAVVGKRIYGKVDGEEILHYDDTVNALSGDALGTKIDAYASGKKLQMASVRGYQPSDATIYDLYDLAFRESVEVDHSDDGGNVIWGVLIGNVEDTHKGNVALQTKVDMSKDRQQNLLIGLGLNGHWPVSGGFGYQIELIADPDNKNDSLCIYKNTNPEGGEPVSCYNAQQNFDFNSSFQLEVGVVDLLDGDGKVTARRIYVKVNGEELMHFDDTKAMISGDRMGNVIAAYVSSGTATLGTCAEGIPTSNVKVYDIYDLLGRASMRLNRTDAGGAVIWTNVLGEVTDTNNLNYALRMNVDTSKVDRSTMQELILGLCKDTDLFDKMGYRLSLYFGTDGGTSLVLRDSAADQVLASADGVYPTRYSLEIGITDFYGSNKEKIGKKIYLKIDGEEVLSYLDKDADRARGSLLCAYTTSPVMLTTNYGYTTIPVTYVVNGETVQSSKYIASNTDVVPGRKSAIDIALGNRDEFTSVLMEQVLLNGKPITPVSEKQDVYVFELENPSENDELTVHIRVHTLTVDEAEVYDLYELTGKNKIVIPANSVDQIATLFADGQEGVLNRAIRFAYYIPATGGGLRLGYGSDTSDIWSRTGTHIEIWCGFATISHGFHVSALSSGTTDIFQPDSWSIVEVGIVKCYEDGIYKYDRWYVKAGKTLEDMELITYYDSTQRHDSTLNIMARTPDTGGDFIVASTLDVRQVTDVSEETAKAEATVAFKPLFLKGEAVKIVVFPKEGKTLEGLYVNGEKVEAVLTSDGGYVFTVENATEDIEFSYVLSDDEQLYSITADGADNLKFTLDQTSVAAGGAVTVQIKVDGGYTLKSLTVNGVDFLPMARYDKTTLTYTLTLRDIREDKHIQAQAEKLSQDGPVADAAAEDETGTNLPVILAVAVLSVAVLGGVVITVVARARKKGQKQ